MSIRFKYKEADLLFSEDEERYNGLTTIHSNKDDLINKNKKIKTIDNDEYIYSNTFNSLLRIEELRPFSPHNKYAIENISKWVSMNRMGYRLISNKIDRSVDDLHFQCDKGHDFYMKFHNMRLLGYACPVCSGVAKYKYKEVYDIAKEKGYTLVSEKYKNVKTKMDFICDKHSEIGVQSTSFESILNSNMSCLECQNERKREQHSKTQQEYEDEIYKLVGDEYTVLGEYVNTHTKILMLHNDCNGEWEVEPNSFLSANTRCPYCSVSSGENKVREFFNINKIQYRQQVRFQDCKNINPLPFDFSVLDKYNDIAFLIEYDGEGHYEPFRFSNDKNKMIEKLKQTQKNDQIKNEYCKDNNIPLIRIPYWQFDKIEQILDKWLNKYGLIHNDDIKEID